MKNNKLKLISLILTIIMISTTFMGCANNTNKTEETGVKETEKIKNNVNNEIKNTRIIKDSADREVEIPKDIEKVVTVGPVGVLNCFVFAMGERVIIVTGCINVLVSRVSGTLTKYNSCIA